MTQFFLFSNCSLLQLSKEGRGANVSFFNDPLWSKSSLTQHPLIECNIPAQGQACSFKSLGAFTNNERVASLQMGRV
jgi:hypothetical protein